MQRRMKTRFVALIVEEHAHLFLSCWMIGRYGRNVINFTQSLLVILMPYNASPSFEMVLFG